jgi:hypothetical protein
MRHRPAATLAAAVSIAAAVAGCGDDQDPQGAEALWERIHAEDYRSWSRAPGYESRRQSSAPHGNEVDIYVNATMDDALGAGAPLASWPDGSLIVKDGFDGSDLELVAAMEKRGSEWYWVEWDGEGSSSYSGKPDVCIDCHASGGDYVRAFGLPE